LTRCLHGEESREWRTIEPETLPIYEDFASKRDRLADSVDSGQLTSEDFIAALKIQKATVLESINRFDNKLLEMNADVTNNRAKLLSTIFTVVGTIIQIAVKGAILYGDARYAAKISHEGGYILPTQFQDDTISNCVTIKKYTACVNG
jgi:hypothetical protein